MFSIISVPYRGLILFNLITRSLIFRRYGISVPYRGLILFNERRKQVKIERGRIISVPYRGLILFNPVLGTPHIYYT